MSAQSRAERGGGREGAGGKSGKNMVQVTHSKSGVHVENGISLFWVYVGYDLRFSPVTTLRNNAAHLCIS